MTLPNPKGPNPPSGRRALAQPRVAIIQRTVPHYRSAFFDRLREALQDKDIELRLLYSQDRRDADWLASRELPWAEPIQELSMRALGREICWQKCFVRTRDLDLVIVEQASRLVLNFVLLARHLRGKQKVAFWGHGRNLRTHSRSRIGETLKTFASRHVHWWFAYTDLSVGIVAEMGFPKERITSVQNAVDTRSLMEAKRQLSEDALAQLRHDLGINDGPVGIFCGTIYKDKRPEFLVEACDLIRNEVEDFQLIVVGDGPASGLLAVASLSRPWIHLIGPQFESDRVPYFSISDVLLIPGAVGLAILDSFALEVPLVTTSISGHGPEISYLSDGDNGLMVRDWRSPAAYATRVVEFLHTPALRDRLVEGCRVAAQRYTLDDMVRRFADGILAALQTNE